MNTNIIEKALKVMLTMSSITDAEREQCVKALQEVACVHDVDHDADLFDNEAVLIPAIAWDGITNMQTYDILGKRMRMHGDTTQFSFYVHDVREELLGYDSIPACYLKDSFEVLRDLWLENEAAGDNDYDGTFKCQASKLRDKVVAADFSCAELGAMAGALEFALNNPECAPEWCTGMSNDEAGEDQSWILDVLQECEDKLDAVNMDTMPECRHVFTVESNGTDTVYDYVNRAKIEQLVKAKCPKADVATIDDIVACAHGSYTDIDKLVEDYLDR